MHELKELSILDTIYDFGLHFVRMHELKEFHRQIKKHDMMVTFRAHARVESGNSSRKYPASKSYISCACTSWKTLGSNGKYKDKVAFRTLVRVESCRVPFLISPLLVLHFARLCELKVKLLQVWVSIQVIFRKFMRVLKFCVSLITL